LDGCEGKTAYELYRSKGSLISLAIVALLREPYV
jgi:hypothetical protein